MELDVLKMLADSLPMLLNRYKLKASLVSASPCFSGNLMNIN